MNEQEKRDAIAALEAQRGLIDDEIIDTSIAALRNQASSADNQRVRALLYTAIVSNATLTDSATTQLLRRLYDLQVRLKSIATEYGGLLSSRSMYNVLATFDASTGSQAVKTAIEAALAIRQELQAQSPDRSGLNPYVQIGIHTVLPTVDLEEFGRSKDQEHLVLKNLAEAAGPNQILASYDAYRDARENFTIHYAKSVEVGDESVRMYSVVGPRREPHVARAAEYGGLQTSMIGRQNELKQLQNALRTCMGERRRVVMTVVGEAGIGKTRLIEEFQLWLGLIPEAVWYFEGHASPSTRLMPYGLVRDMLIRRFQIVPSDNYPEAQKKLTQGIVDILGEANLEDAHLISQLIGLDFSASSLSASDNPYLRDQAITALLSFFRTMISTYRDPVVVVLEHMQWADEASFLFFQQLLFDTNQPMPLLVIMTTRTMSEEMPPLWHYKAHVNNQELMLDPLSPDVASLLIAELLRNMVNVPTDLTATMVESTDGNPRYILELVQHLLTSNQIINNEDGWLANLPETGAVLPSKTEIAAKRFQSLSTNARLIVTCAAVIGDIATEHAIRHLAKVDDVMRFQTTMDELVDMGIFQVMESTNFPGTTEYTFANGLFRRFVYEAALPANRRQYHARYASWLIGQGVNRVSLYAGIIAGHYQWAEDIPRAIKWHLLAAQQAEKAFATNTTLYHYEHAIHLSQQDIATHQQQYFASLMGLARAYGAQARYNDALGIIDTVLAYTNNPPERGEALVYAARIHNQLGYPNEALRTASEAVEIYEAAEDTVHEQMGRAWLNISRAYRRLNNIPLAITYADKVLELGQAIRNDSLVAATYNVLGTIYMAGSQNPEMATVYFNKALETARRQGNLTLVAQLSNNIAESARIRGDFQSSLVMYRKTEEAAQRIGNQHIVISSILNMGAAWLGLHKFGKAAEALQQALSLIGNQTNSERYCEALWLYASALIGLQHFDDAREILVQAHSLALMLNQPVEMASVWRVSGEWCSSTRREIHLQGHAYSAIACFAQSYAILEDSEASVHQAYTLRAWARHLYAAGAVSDGIARLRRAIDIMEHVGATFEQETMQTVLHDWQQQGGLGTGN